MSIIAEAFTGKTGKNGSCLFSLCNPTIFRSVSKCAKHEVCQREWCKHECENRNQCNFYQTVLLFTPSFPFCSSKLNQGIRNRTASRYTQKSQELKKYHASPLQPLPIPLHSASVSVHILWQYILWLFFIRQAKYNITIPQPSRRDDYSSPP